MLIRDGSDAICQIIVSGGFVRVVSNLYQDLFSLNDENGKIYVSGNSANNSITLKNNKSGNATLNGYVLMGMITNY